jgi:hypothetical protein
VKDQQSVISTDRAFSRRRSVAQQEKAIAQSGYFGETVGADDQCDA